MGPAKNQDLHGNVPDESPAALLVVDVITDFEFEDGDRLLPRALAMSERLATLRRRAKAAGIPIVYVNDNYGRWQADVGSLVERSLASAGGRQILAHLRPEADDYVVLKPKHSALFSTPLDTLLRYLRVDTLLITGLTTDVCVLFTANDAFLRDFSLLVPRDCVAAVEADAHRQALDYMRRVLRADIPPSEELDVAAFTSLAGSRR